jgi:hypothetical protein
MSARKGHHLVRLKSSATLNSLSYIHSLHHSLIAMRLRDPESETVVTRIYLNGLPTHCRWKLLSLAEIRFAVAVCTRIMQPDNGLNDGFVSWQNR